MDAIETNQYHCWHPLYPVNGLEHNEKCCWCGAVRMNGAKARFAEEARHVGRLEHPSVVPVYDLGELPDGLDMTGLEATPY